ncbi:cytochrome P450 CYP82D47 [Ziziphus jujuba]|uniref:Cytochrome P450 CYP82D47 n=1 Tax=Ziziphus jujuba TaxID=326968 RepID=A0A6P3Z7L3_ZIZJJ|nr:cytochrome P450 CYP82D47 [Ziziphus jujuba]
MDHFLIPFTSTIGFCALLLISYTLLRSRRVTNCKGKIPPEARGAWPIIGHLPMLGGSKPPHITLAAMAEKNGPVFTVRLGVHRALVVSSPETAKECFTINDVEVSSRPKLIAVKHFGYNHAMFNFAPYGNYWREIRKIVTVHLLSSRRIELLDHVRVSEIGIYLKQLYVHWTEKKNESNQVLVEMKQWFGDLTLSVIARMVAGKQFFVGGDHVGDEKEIKESRQVQNAMREFFHLVGLFLPGDAVPYLGWLDLGGYEKAMKKTAKQLDEALEKWLQEHKRKRERGGGEVVKEEQDFMDVMLSVLPASGLAGYDADIINKTTTATMIAGGSDTTTVTIIWALSLLLNNRHALKKAKDELDAIVGHERFVKESDLNQLVYLQATIKETLRLYPAAPLAGPRIFTEDCIIGGFHVPKGTRLITNLWKIHTDSEIWEDPLEFKPERFLTTHKDIDFSGQNFEYMPFGSGRRACPGSSFGLQMVSLSLASFLHAFEISTPLDAPVDMTESSGMTNLKATPLDVLVKPRLPAKLYA